MIVFRCRHCGRTLQVAEILAGSQTDCTHCDRPVAVPYDIDCEAGWPCSPDADTLTAAELQLLSQVPTGPAMDSA
jgi:hypothetical protein